jgi:hypothetical protein
VEGTQNSILIIIPTLNGGIEEKHENLVFQPKLKRPSGV